MDDGQQEQQEALVPPTPVEKPSRRPWQVTVVGGMLLAYAVFGQLALGWFTLGIIGILQHASGLDYITFFTITIPAEAFILLLFSIALSVLRQQPSLWRTTRIFLLGFGIFGGLYAFGAASYLTDPELSQSGALLVRTGHAGLLFWGIFIVLLLVDVLLFGLPLYLLHQPAAKQAFGDERTLDNPPPSPPE